MKGMKTKKKQTFESLPSGDENVHSLNSDRSDFWLKEDEEVKGKDSITTRLRAGFTFYKELLQPVWILEIVVVFLSIVWCILYVVQTYLDDYPLWIESLDLSLASVFFLCFLLNLFMAENRLRYLISPFAIVDYFTIIPAFFASTHNYKIIRVFAILRIFRLTRMFKLISSDFIRKITQLVLTVCTMIFISACIMLLIEKNTFQSFHQALYFVIVSISTVGYGDIHPVTVMGQIAVMVLLMTAFTLIPILGYSLNKLLREQKSKYMRVYPLSHLPFVVIMGHLTVTNVNQFLDEFFHEIHTTNYKVVILNPANPLHPDTENWINLIHQQKYYSKLYYYKGDPLNRDDLQRIRLESAAACFLLNDALSSDVDKSDQEIVLYCHSASSYKVNIPLFVQLINHSNKELISSIPFCSVMCINEIKMGIIAQSILTPGFSALIGDLIMSKNINHAPGSSMIMQYICPSSYYGKYFLEVAAIIHKDKQATLIGVLRKNKLLLNPGGEYKISDKDTLILISPVTSRLPDTITTTKKSNDNEIELQRRSIPSNYDTMEILQKKYHMSDTAHTFDEAKNFGENISNHVVVIGNITECITLVSALRDINIQKCYPIIILSESIPTKESWDEIAFFPEVFFVQGSSMKKNSLLKAKVESAHKIIILNKYCNKIDHLSIDKNTILAYINLKNYIKESNILIELSSIQSLQLLHHSKNFLELKQHTQETVLDISLFQSIQAQTFFYPIILAVLKQLAHGPEYQILLSPIPDELRGNTYSSLFNHFINSELICLGLYKKNKKDTYILTNPPLDAPLENGDWAFVLAKGSHKTLKKII